jgi:hypothetical protein
MSFDVSIFQIMASLALTGMSLIVSGVSLYFGYRHNRGRKPAIVLVERARFSGAGPPSLAVIFEVWNRHKYPIVIKEVDVQFDRFTFLAPPEIEADGNSVAWFLEENRTFESYHSVRLEPDAHHRLSLRAPYKEETDDGKPENPSIDVLYFDPINNKEMTVKSKKMDL